MKKVALSLFLIVAFVSYGNSSEPSKIKSKIASITQCIKKEIKYAKVALNIKNIEAREKEIIVDAKMENVLSWSQMFVINKPGWDKGCNNDLLSRAEDFVWRVYLKRNSSNLVAHRISIINGNKTYDSASDLKCFKGIRGCLN